MFIKLVSPKAQPTFTRFLTKVDDKQSSECCVEDCSTSQVVQLRIDGQEGEVGVLQRSAVDLNEDKLRRNSFGFYVTASESVMFICYDASWQMEHQGNFNELWNVYSLAQGALNIFTIINYQGPQKVWNIVGVP